MVIDNFSNYGFTTPLKNNNVQKIKDSFENFLINLKRKSNLIETDRGRDFYNKNFQDFLKKNDIKIYSRNTSLGAVFAECFIKSIRNPLKNPVFGKGDGNWIVVLPTITKQYYDGIHSSTKLTPKQASLKKNEGYVYHISIDKRKKVKPKFQVNDLVRVADIKKTSSKGDTTIWFYILCEITEIIKETIPNFYIDNLPGRYSEALVKNTDVTTKQIDKVLTNLNLD